MAEFRKYIYALALVALLAGITAPASAQASMVCSATATVPPSLRAEGMTELAGDIIVDCTGGSPTLAGTLIPQVNITVSTNVALTSKITNTFATAGCAGCAPINFSEAIIIVDQPNSSTWSNAAAAFGGTARSILNCGSAGAPDSNVATGPGVCEITAISTAAVNNSWLSYDGTPCAAGTAYGCGRPNVFQARQDTTSAFPQQRITFLDVPIDPPGFFPVPAVPQPGVNMPPNCEPTGICHRILRITNIRVNAANLGGASGSLVSGQPVFADLTVNPTTNLPLVNVASLTIGRVNTSLGTPTGANPQLTLVGCRDTSQDVGTVTFSELVADAWKPRNISQLLSNNAVGLPLYNLAPGIAAGTAAAVNAAYDCLQNVPGANYETEAAFQNTAAGGAVCPAGLPTPNPPSGIGFGAVNPPAGFAFSDNHAGTWTNIQAAGVATSGTRLMVNVQNIIGLSSPATVTVSVPSQIVLRNRGTGAPTGVAVLQSYAPACIPTVPGDNVFCPANGGFPVGGPANQVTISTFSQGNCTTISATNTPGVAIAGSACSAGRLFYEILFADPGVLEQLTIPFHVSFVASVLSLQPPVNPSPIAVANGFMGYAPHYPLAAPQSFATPASLPATPTAFPYPRFVDTAYGPFNLFSISGKCTCNLLFPYVTDGALPAGSSFDTGIAIANTSRDPGSVGRAAGLTGGGASPLTAPFGFLTGAQEQQGPVQFWYYSTQQGSSSPNFGNLGNGQQGNTQCTNVATPGQCNDLLGALTLNTGTNVPAGGVLGTSVKNGSATWGLLPLDGFVAAPERNFTGYVIAQASFQYCHGVAFISTNGLASVAGLSIPSLSYVALELDNNNGLAPRTNSVAETLGH